MVLSKVDSLCWFIHYVTYLKLIAAVFGTGIINTYCKKMLVWLPFLTKRYAKTIAVAYCLLCNAYGIL